jgi:hypothetical protein
MVPLYLYYPNKKSVKITDPQNELLKQGTQKFNSLGVIKQITLTQFVMYFTKRALGEK